MTRTEAILRLEEIADEIYDKLYEMEDILREAAPEELERARVYLAHIDGALLNRNRWMEGSLISLKNILISLEEK